MKSIKFVSGSALGLLIFLLLISSYPNVCYSFYSAKKDNSPALQANPIIKIEYNMSPGRGGLVDGKWKDYEQDTATIKKSIEDRIRKADYKIITSGSDYEYVLKIKYFERVSIKQSEGVSSIPQWGDMVYIFSYVLEQRNGNIILNSGEEQTYQWGEKANFNYAFIEKLVDSAIKGKDIFPLYKSLLAERRFMDRIIKLLPEYKDARAIGLLVPFLRDTSESIRRFTRSSLTSLGYKPESEKEEIAMAIVETGEHWDFNRPQQVVFKYGMPAIELYLEDLKIGYGRPVDEVIKRKAANALQAVKASANKELNEYVITKMIEVLETQGEGLKNYIAYLDDANEIKSAKLFYMVEAINIVAEIGDQRVVEVLKGYVDHPSVGGIVFRNERGEEGKLIVARIDYLEKKLKQKLPEKQELKAPEKELDQISDLLKSAELESESGNLQQAIEMYQDVLKISKSPENRMKAYHLLANIYEVKGQLNRSIECMHLRSAEAEKKSSPISVLSDTLLILSKYIKAGQKDAAFEAVKTFKAMAIPPLDKMLPLAYLRIYLELEDVDNAAKQIKGVEEFLQTFGLGKKLEAVVLEAQGRIKEMKGKYKEAILDYQKALELNPNLTDQGMLESLTDMRSNTNKYIGRCYRMLKEFKKAEEYLQKALEIHPFNPETHYELALVYSDMGNRETALERLKIALDVWKDADPEFKPAIKAKQKLAEWESLSKSNR